MRAHKGLAGSILSAAIVAIVTLSVFGVLQNYGPESAIRRFHMALRSNDPSALQPVCVQPLNSSDFDAFLSSGIARIASSNLSYRIMRTDKSDSQDVSVLAYSAPGGRLVWVVWVVDLNEGLWKVDVTKTLEANQQVLGSA